MNINIRIETPDGDWHRTDRFRGHDTGRRETEHDEREKERVNCENAGQYDKVHQMFE